MCILGLKDAPTGFPFPLPHDYSASRMPPPVGPSWKTGAGRRKGPWSQAEIERLKRLYGMRSDGVVARELNRSVESVRRMARRVFSGSPVVGPWTASEVEALKNYLGAATLETISLVLRRPEEEIRRKVESLKGEIKSRPWTPSDIQVLKRLYGTRTTQDLLLILGRPESEIESKAAEVCLAKDKGFQRRRGEGTSIKMPRWTPEHVDTLRRLYPDSPNLEIARILNRSVKSVVSKAHDLSLKKSERRLRSMGRENVEVRYSTSQAVEVESS